MGFIDHINHLAQTRQVENRHARDPLAGTRRVLQLNEALTFNQLSWPTDDQLAGNDDGVYYASAQLFVNQLLARKNGPAKMRAFLGQLPAYMNWQTAFFAAFHEDFTRPLEVEKWWSLQVVGFTARDPGPRWTLAASHDKLDSLLVVPAEFRTATNALPEMRDISLQEAIRTIPPDALAGVLENRLRDLQLAQMRLALPYVMLARFSGGTAPDHHAGPRQPRCIRQPCHRLPAGPAGGPETALGPRHPASPTGRAAEAECDGAGRGGLVFRGALQEDYKQLINRKSVKINGPVYATFNYHKDGA